VADELCDFDTNPGVHLERDYAASPEELWDAWTEPKRLARWLCTSAAPFLESTGPVRLLLGDAEDQWVDVRVLVAEPPHRLELAWSFAGEVNSLLRVRIDRVSESMSRVAVDHAGLGRATIGYGAGWQAYLEMLGGQFESTIVKPWDELFEECLPIWRERAIAWDQRASSRIGQEVNVPRGDEARNP
jgi:uncharacterized protein YndB with AHSA1/START domain